MFGGIVSSLLGSVASAATSGLFNAREADKNRDFQTTMSNTARQRDVADLKAAGLNPVLAAGYGGSPPSGSTASISVPDAGSTITNARQQSDQRELIRAQTAATKAQAAKTGAETIAISRNLPIQDLQNEILTKAVSTARNLGSEISGAKFSPSTPVQNIKSWVDRFRGN